MAPIVFRPSRWKAALLFLMMGVFVAGALYVARLPDLRIYERACGWAAAAVFGWGVLIALRRLFMIGPAIEISDWGVKDFRQNITAPWDKIKSVKVWWDEMDAARVPWIALDIDDAESVFVNQDHIARNARLVNRVLLHPEVALKTQGLPGAHRGVMAAIKRLRPDLIRE